MFDLLERGEFVVVGGLQPVDLGDVAGVLFLLSSELRGEMFLSAQRKDVSGAARPTTTRFSKRTIVLVVISMLFRRVYMWNCQSIDFFRVRSLVFRRKSSASCF
jgi:hypothetical protein